MTDTHRGSATAQPSEAHAAPEPPTTPDAAVTDRTARAAQTARSERPEPELPDIGAVGMLRWAWRQLTSMRTALFLLLLIAIAAVPGSVFPQRNIDSGRVADYLAQNPTTGPWLDRLGFFDVYSSPWFSAIYLMLFVSLLGCIIPRTRVHLRALRSQPPKAPARLTRLPESVQLQTSRTPQEVIDAAQVALRAKRFRVRVEGSAVSAESGYARETGNLLFHLALTGIIVGMAVGHVFGWRGDLILPEKTKFASSAKTYNTFSPGPWTDEEDLPPFVMTLNRFTAIFNDEAGRGFGMAREFTAHTTVQDTPTSPARPVDIAVNHPLSVGGADVFLLGNGYAPVVTVRNAAGEVLYREPTPFLAQDANYRSVGVVKVSALPEGKQLGLTGFFLPTAEPTFAQGPMSLFPDARDPELALSVWEGSLFPGGMPQSVYTLNTDEMKQVTKDDGTPALVRLKPGQTYAIPGGRGTVTFEEVRRFAGLSVRTDPGAIVSLVSAVLATGGLLLGLLVKRRRVFVRVQPVAVGPGAGGGKDGEPGVTVVTVGGLSKDSDAGLARIIASLAEQLSGQPGGRAGQPGGQPSDHAGGRAGEARGAQNRPSDARQQLSGSTGTTGTTATGTTATGTTASGTKEGTSS